MARNGLRTANLRRSSILGQVKWIDGDGGGGGGGKEGEEGGQTGGGGQMAAAAAAGRGALAARSGGDSRERFRVMQAPGRRFWMLENRKEPSFRLHAHVQDPLMKIRGYVLEPGKSCHSCILNFPARLAASKFPSFHPDNNFPEIDSFGAGRAPPDEHFEHSCSNTVVDDLSPLGRRVSHSDRALHSSLHSFLRPE